MEIFCILFFIFCLGFPSFASILYSIFDRSDNIITIPEYIIVEKYLEVEPVSIKNIAAKRKKSNSGKSKNKPTSINKTKEDAVAALVSLGMKKTDASKKANEMFAKKEYKTIEDFLLDVYKK